MMSSKYLEYSINYIGYLTALISLGEGARRCLSSLKQFGWDGLNCVDATCMESDIEHAVELMKELYFFPDKSKKLGLQAKNDIINQLSKEIIGKMLTQRLMFICDRLAEKNYSSFIKKQYKKFKNKFHIEKLI